jgi:hypothetical protein
MIRKSRVLKHLTVTAGISVVACPVFAHSECGSDIVDSSQTTTMSQSVEIGSPQLPGSGEMKTTDRNGTTGPSGSRAFSTAGGAIDAIARVAKPAGDYAATGIDRDLAALIRTTVVGDPELALWMDNSFRIIVDNGAVTLLGQVMNARVKEQITAKVKAVTGVQSVDNQLLISRR